MCKSLHTFNSREETIVSSISSSSSSSSIISKYFPAPVISTYKGSITSKILAGVLKIFYDLDVFSRGKDGNTTMPTVLLDSYVSRLKISFIKYLKYDNHS